MFILCEQKSLYVIRVVPIWFIMGTQYIFYIYMVKSSFLFRVLFMLIKVFIGMTEVYTKFDNKTARACDELIYCS